MMSIGVRVTACAILFGQFIAIPPVEAAGASAAHACAKDAGAALETARKALASDRRDEDRTALVCLVEAVAALDERIRGLSAGSIAFDGQIYAPKGVVMVKPSDQEGR